MDPGTVVGIVSLGIQVCQGLLKYYDSWDGYEDDVRQAYQRIAELGKTFGFLEGILQSIPPGDLPTRASECLIACKDGLERLDKKLKKLHKENPIGIAQKTHSGIIRAVYPFRASTLEKLKEIVRDLTSHLKLSIQILLLHNSAETGDAVAQIAYNVDGLPNSVANIQTTLLETKAQTESVNAGVRALLSDAESKHLRDIVEWLDAPDQSIDHDEARQKHEPGTGQWFLDSRHYQDWLGGPSSRLWLHGKAGCCKTVLCSTIIEDVQRRLSSQTGAVLVYFYFSFADIRKQSYHSLLLSLVTKLIKDCFVVHPSISTAFDRRRKPDIRVLEEALVALLRGHRTSYVVVDALDECPETGDERERVMQGLGRIAKMAIGTRFLVTSRKESDIEEFMQTWTNVRLAIDEKCVSADIDTFIKAALVNDPKLKRLPDTVKEEIEDTFHANSDGMFRWAALQLQSIRSLKIPRPSYISAALHTMPRSLDETYERILAAIDELYYDEVRVALQWLTFSEAPLSVVELVEACSIGLDNVNHEGSLDECNEETIAGLLSVISPLVLVEDGIPITRNNRLPKKFSDARRAQHIRLAHFTVKEYLLSNRLQTSRISRFSLNTDSYYDLARTCCAYLINFTDRSETQKWIEERPLAFQQAGKWSSIVNFTPSYPLLPHAARLWSRYQALAESQLAIPQSDAGLHLEVIQNERVRVSWLCLGGCDRTDDTNCRCAYDPKFWRDGTTALYWAALLRFDRTISILYEQDCCSDINRIGGVHGTAIQAAAYSGAESIVRFLLDRGADVNLRAGKYGTALQAAAHEGYEKIVEILIHAGADGTDGHALEAASTQGHEKIVRLLVDNGAYADLRLGLCDNGLETACSSGYEKIVQILLTVKHVDVSLSYGHALQAASSTGEEEIVKILLSNNADPNVQGGLFGTALMAASCEGYEKIAAMLLLAGADPNVQVDNHGSALKAAFLPGHENFVQIVLTHRARGIAQGPFGNALCAASYWGHDKTVQLLLENNADVDARGGRFDTALMAASSVGHEKVVQMLLAKGADANIQGESVGNALYASIERGNEEIVRLLLENGANPNNVPASHTSSALEKAALYGNEKIFQMLLENGANPNNVLASHTSSALEKATLYGNEKVFQLLLEKDAGVTGKAASGAVGQGQDKILGILLERGAEVDAQRALSDASFWGHWKVLQLLLDKYANAYDADILRGEIQRASRYRPETCVRILSASLASMEADRPSLVSSKDSRAATSSSANKA
ncbi:ankyrin repeat-containing domain protein [Nemania sp. NC0429]|nr:ankyrin repeat-containing domain protein [Nemania sp. NC0429]